MHDVLKNQFQRLKLSEDAVPDSQQAWQDFIALIDKAYVEADQERYLNERSREISSRELTELNEKLANAQRIAKLGYWDYDKTCGVMTLSCELHNLFNPQSDSKQLIRDLPTFLQQIDVEDQEKLNSAIERAFSQGEKYEMELRSSALEQERRWYRMIAHPLVDEQGERTKLSGIIIDITYYKQVEEKIFRLNQQLVDAARKAGMADIATSVLHNIGNVLNSASVSISLAQEKFDDAVLEKLQVLIDLINKHRDSLGEYLINDEKGKLIPEYLRLIATRLAEQNGVIKDEIVNVDAHLQHIKAVVAMQQSLSKPVKVCEQVLLVDLIDTALKMSGCDENKKNITLEKDYKVSPTMTTDRTKVIEILVNLFRNSQQAMTSKGLQEINVMNIAINQNEIDEMVKITVSDNGPGISPEHKVKIFAFNFTTKPDGHGVGLHASANLAKELGGSLQLEESVPGEGAIFSLLLPVNLKQVKQRGS